MAMSAVVFETTFTVGNFDHLSIATSISASLFNSSRRGRQNLIVLPHLVLLPNPFKIIEFSLKLV